MLYFIYGTKRDKVREKRDEVVAQLRGKRPNANFVVLDNENFSEAKLDELIAGGGLFDEKHIVALNFLFSDKSFGAALVSRAGEMEKSPSAFICADGEMGAEALKKIEKVAYKTVELGTKIAEGRKENSSTLFAIADALGARSSEKAWALYTKAIQEGFSPEEIHGTLFWQVKSIALASKAKSPTDSGLAPFVFQKSFRYAKNFSERELKSTLHALVAMYHESRTEDSDSLETGLEQFLLSLKKI